MYLDRLTDKVIDEIVRMARGEKTDVDVVETINSHIDKFFERVPQRDEVARHVGAYIRKSLLCFDGADLVASAIEAKIVLEKNESKPAGGVISDEGCRYGLDRVVEVREARTPEEANELLAEGWRLIQVNGRFFVLARFNESRKCSAG